MEVLFTQCIILLPLFSMLLSGPKEKQDNHTNTRLESITPIKTVGNLSYVVTLWYQEKSFPPEKLYIHLLSEKEMSAVISKSVSRGTECGHSYGCKWNVPGQVAQ